MLTNTISAVCGFESSKQAETSTWCLKPSIIHLALGADFLVLYSLTDIPQTVFKNIQRKFTPSLKQETTFFSVNSEKMVINVDENKRWLTANLHQLFVYNLI